MTPLTQNETDAVIAYAVKSASLNSWLLGGRVTPGPTQLARDLRSAICKQNTLTSINLWSAGPWVNFSGILNGTLHYPAFLSTSASEASVRSYYDQPVTTRLRICVPASTAVLDVDAIPEANNGDNEFLFADGARLALRKYREVTLTSEIQSIVCRPISKRISSLHDVVAEFVGYGSKCP